jgi:hypothetical protein
MSNEDGYYDINALARGMVFYGGVGLVSISSEISVETSVSAFATATREIDIDEVEIDTNFTSVSAKIHEASSSIDILSVSLSIAIEIALLSVNVEIDSSLASSAIKVASADTSLSSDISSEFSARRIKSVTSSPDINVSVNAAGRRIQFGFSEIEITSEYGIRFTTTYRIDLGLSVESSVAIYNLTRFTTGSRYPGSIVPLIYLDGMPLTEQNRKYDISISPVFVENRNWNNTKSRYYKRDDDGRMTFKLTWSWLPNDRENTVDKGFARDYIKDLANDLDSHVLKVIEYGENPEDIFNEEEYTVFITNYTEDLIRRDLVSGTYFWDCSLDLEQV